MTTTTTKKPGRPPTTKTAPAESPEILPAVAERITTGQELATAAQMAARAEAQRLGYLLPADSADPDLIQRDIAANMRRSVEAVLEVGKGLAVLKVACGHGNFGARLQVLGIDDRLARRFMQSALRFGNRVSTPVLAAAGNQTKLFELLVLDDESIQALEEDGATAGGLTLDEIDRMSTSELRAALRKEKRELARQKEVNTELHQEVMEYKVKGKVVALTDWPEALVPVSDQVAAASRKLATALGELEACRIAIFAAGEPLGDAERVAFDAALGHVAEVYEQALAKAERQIERERTTFDKTLGAYAEGN